MEEHDMTSFSDVFERDDIQFARLLAEIRAVGLTGKQVDELRESTGLSSGQIHELLERAENKFDSAKANLPLYESTCLLCGRGEASDEKTLLRLSRSVIRDMARGWLDNDLVVSPQKLVERITAMLGDTYDFDRGD